MIHRLCRYLSGTGLGPALIKAVTGSAGLRVAGMGFAFLVGMQLARGLGADGYGIYGVAMSISALLTVPVEFGFPLLLTREAAAAVVNQEWGRLKGILSWSTRLSMALAVVMAGGFLVWLVLSDRNVTSPLVMTLLAGMAMMPIVAMISLKSAMLRGLQHIVGGQLSSVLVRPMVHSLLLFVVSLFVIPLSPALAMVLGVVAAGVALVMVQIMLHRAMPIEVASATAVIDAQGWLSSVLPMAMAESMRFLQGHVLTLILGWMVVISDVGIYRVASSVMLLIAMPISLFTIVSMPVIAKLHAGGEYARMQKVAFFFAVGTTAGVLCLSIPFFLAGDRILSFVFGSEFGASGEVLAILCVAVAINAVFGVSVSVLNMTGHQRCVTRASTVSLLILLISSVPLVYFYGVVGAAVSNSVALVSWNVLMWWDSRRLVGIDASIFSARRLLSRRD